MRTKIVIGILLVCFSTFIKGQTNLVPNGSFENIESCPTFPNGPNLAFGWFSPMTCIEFPGLGFNLFNVCCTEYTSGVPGNSVGYQFPHSGSSYTGIQTFNTVEPNLYRQYITSKLDSLLIENKKYLVSFYVSLASSYESDCGASDIGAYLSMDSILTCYSQEYPAIILSSHINYSESLPIMDTTNWVLIQGEYIALGGENFITIGNFLDGLSVVYDTTGLPQNNIIGSKSFYFIDDVSVTEIDTNVGIKETQMSSIKLYPNPTSNDVTFEYSPAETSIYEIELSDIAGRKLISQKLTNQEGKVNFSTNALSAGIYLFSVKENNRIKYQTKLCVLK